MKILGVEFSPLSIPVERRLQTFAVFFWMGLFVASTLLCIPWLLLAYILLFSRLWFFGLLYLAWLYHDISSCNRGGWSGWANKWVRGWPLWNHFKDFFPIKMVKTSDLDPQRNYLLCSHPHGVLSAGAFCCFATEGTNFSEVFPGITPHLLVLEQMFWIPFFRDLWSTTGSVAATKKGMESVLSSKEGGQAAVLVPGGAPEALNCDKGEVRLILNKKKGFVKLALRCGVSLVPTFSFGEAAIYDKLESKEGSVLRSIQDFLTSIAGFAPVVFLGRGIFQYSFGIVPHRKPITLVVGAPIPAKQIANPSEEDVEKLHAKYVRHLQRLYKEHNPYPEIKLVIG